MALKKKQQQPAVKMHMYVLLKCGHLYGGKFAEDCLPQVGKMARCPACAKAGKIGTSIIQAINIKSPEEKQGEKKKKRTK